MVTPTQRLLGCFAPHGVLEHEFDLKYFTSVSFITVVLARVAKVRDHCHEGEVHFIGVDVEGVYLRYVVGEASSGDVIGQTSSWPA